MKIKEKVIALFLLLVVFASCEDDDTDGDSNVGNILITASLPNPDGQSGGHYMRLITNMEEASYENTVAIPIPFSGPPYIVGKDIFILPGWGMETDLMTKYSHIDNRIVKQGELLMPPQSGATSIVTHGNKAYVALGMLGKIMILDHSTMKKTGEIDISEYGRGDQNPDPASMIIRDDLLYVGLTQMVGGFMPAADRAKADVLIIDTKTDKAVKMITEEKSGISTPTRPIDPKSIFIDENNDIYIACIGAWGAHPNHKTGILRIKSGETEFDPNYVFTLNDVDVIGENNSLSYLQYVHYAGNGKLYATANFMAYHSDPANYIEDRTVVPVEIDLKTKTVTKLDLPRSNSYGVAIGQFKQDIVFGLATNSDNGFFTYNVQSGTTSSHAIVKTQGYPFYYHCFEK